MYRTLFASPLTFASNWTDVRLPHDLSLALIFLWMVVRPQDNAYETISLIMLTFAPGITACIDFAHPDFIFPDLAFFYNNFIKFGSIVMH
jgi:hypothetical protein